MIQINLDLVMAQKRISAGRLAELIDLTPANLSILKNNIDHIKPIAAPRVDPIIDTTSG